MIRFAIGTLVAPYVLNISVCNKLNEDRFKSSIILFWADKGDNVGYIAGSLDIGLKNNSGEKRANSREWDNRSMYETYDLERHSWRNWMLLAGVLLITILGLATAIPPLMSEPTFIFWPWQKTDYALLGGLSLIVLIFVGYLTHQQHLMIVMRNQLQQLQEQKKERMKQHTERLYKLLNVSRIMESKFDIQHVLDRITKICVEVFECHQASLMLFDEETQELEVRSTGGHSYMTQYIGKRQKLGEGIAGWAAAYREPLLLGSDSDLRKFTGDNYQHRPIKAAMVVPIFRKDNLVGVINVGTRSPYQKFDKEDLHGLEVFAENAGVCIHYPTQAL